MAPREQRATRVAFLGLLIQMIVLGCLIGVGMWSRSDVCIGAARFAAVGLPIWIALVLVFKQKGRVAIEALEAAELRRARAAGADPALFEIDEEALHIERRKFEGLVKYLLPGVTLLLAVVILIGHFILWNWSFSDVFGKEGLSRTENPTLVMWFVGGAGLISFWFGRYAIGLARLRDWSLVRAGASFMTGCALVCLGGVLGMGLSSTFDWAEPLVAYLIRAGLFVLGLEFLVNFVADFYRPRAPGEVGRPSFDSRLLGLVTEPGGIAKSIAEAINYQFGFEVSKTWLYQLLEATVLPLMLVTVLAMILLSSVITVDADEAAVVERFGRRLGQPGETIGPGFSVKLPWPIDVVYRAPLKRVNGIEIGETSADVAEEERNNKAILWTEEHGFHPEMMVIVAKNQAMRLTPDDDAGAEGGVGDAGRSVAVSLVMASVPIRYRIVDLDAYLYRYTNPEKLLESIAYRTLSKYAAGVNLESLMGPGRRAFNDRLVRAIQAEVDQRDIGIEVIFCGLESVHPPSKDEVAAEFQKVIAAEADKLNSIHTAEGRAETILTSVAGSRSRALQLDAAIQERDRLEKLEPVDEVALAAARDQVDALLVGNGDGATEPIGGEAAGLIAEAREASEKRISLAASKARAFSAEVTAYLAAPELYKVRKSLEVFDSVDAIRKYLVIGDPSKVLFEYENVEPTTLNLGENQ